MKIVYLSIPWQSFHELWTAPEGLEGRFSIQSDIWSFGVTAWEIFTVGLEPFYGDGSNISLELKKGTRLPKPAYANDEM